MVATPSSRRKQAGNGTAVVARAGSRPWSRNWPRTIRRGRETMGGGKEGREERRGDGETDVSDIKDWGNQGLGNEGEAEARRY
jgi:hypothetical protein